MSTLSITNLYEIFSNKIGKEPAESLTSYIEEKIDAEMEKKADIFATKEDLANTKADLIKWMFLFWIAQVGATFGFIILYFKK